MVNSKKTPIVFGFLIILIFFVFSLGQLLRIDVTFLGKKIVIQPLDVCVFLFVFTTFLNNPNFLKDKVVSIFTPFFVILIFSLLLSLAFFPVTGVVVGLLYLARLTTYFLFMISIKNFLDRDIFKSPFLLSTMIIAFVFTGILGWVQYLFYSDLRSLKFVGWDDHLGRLVGTYLDPGFTGIIFLIACFFTLFLYLKFRRSSYLFLSLFFLVTLLFTYSRASFLALFFGLFFFAFTTRKFRLTIAVFLLTFIVIFSLPRGKGEGVKLERTKSAYQRFQNYQETFQVVKNYPLFGVGYNNLCFVRKSVFSDLDNSHACSGSDSSLLFLLATTGILGLITFLYGIFRTLFSLSKSTFSQLLETCVLALLIHSQFVNSIFYPHTLALFAVLGAFALSEST